VPATWATGPASARPIGRTISDPATSYAYTRLSRCAGTCVCTVVAHITLQNANPPPAAANPAAIR